MHLNKSGYWLKITVALLAGLSIVLFLLLYSWDFNDKQEEYKEFTAFFAFSGLGHETNKNNRIQNKIEELTNTKVSISWIGNKRLENIIDKMIARNEYPDFIDGAKATSQLILSGAYIPLEDYLQDYPNLYSYLSEDEWELMRSDDGHIYIIPQFGIVYGNETDTSHREEAFFIQKDVLKWAGYPKVTTVKEYFNLIGEYLKTHPTINDKQTQGFLILCDGWRGFSLSNVPQFIAGYPNDGCAIVDDKTKTAKLYDFIPEAKEYYRLLNEAYHYEILKGDTFVMTYEQYISQLKTGSVLGVIDQYWQFEAAQESLYQQGLPERTYVPLGLTIEDGVTERYRSVEALDISNGIGISVSCKDVRGALSYINQLLGQNIMKLRFWGEEGIDYSIDEDGLFYRSEEQRKNASSMNYLADNFYTLYYFPHFDGMLADGINTIRPAEQPKEFFAALPDYDKELLNAYGYQTFVDFLNKPEEENAPWFPLYSFTNNLNPKSEIGKINKRLEEIRKEWLPLVIMSEEGQFDIMWENYSIAFHNQIDINIYENALTEEIGLRSKK